MRKADGGGVVLERESGAAPEHAAKAHVAAVQAVHYVVRTHVHLAPVEREARVRDAPRHPTDRHTEPVGVLRVLRRGVVTFSKYYM